MEKLGINNDWSLTKNACDTPMCTKKVALVSMQIFEGINGRPCNITIFGNRYIPCINKELSSHDFESACEEADDIYREKLTDAIKYLTEQLSLLPGIKFYEFIDFPYYALICAESGEKAIEYYKECVSDVEDEESFPAEISLEEAKTKFLDCAASEEEKQKAIDEFNKYICDSEPTVLVIDSSLV